MKGAKYKMDELEVHESYFYEAEPFTINALALNEKHGMLAVSRQADFGEEKHENLIELWNVIGKPVFNIKTIALDRLAAESLVWIDEMIVAAHMDGSISCHRLHSPKSFVAQVASSAISCLSEVSRIHLCAGTDSGTVLLLTISEDGISLVKTFSVGFDAHILSVASNGTIIAAASMDEITLISVKNLKIEHTLRLPRIEKRKPSIVWCLCFVNDMLASGDSRGFITLWNPENGALIQSLLTHQADILALASSENMLYAAGADPTIAKLAPTQNDGVYRVEHKRTIHTNDVRALASSKSTATLFSGGAEHFLRTSTRLKHDDALKNISRSFAGDCGRIAFQYSNRVVLWKLGTADPGNREAMSLPKETPQKLAQICSHLGQYILTSALSNDAELLAISTQQSVTIYSVDFKQERRIKVVRRIGIQAAALMFTSDSIYLSCGNFTVFKISLNGIKKDEDLDTVIVRDNAGEVVRWHCNTDETMLVILSTRNELYLLDIVKRFSTRLEVSGLNVYLDAQFINTTTLYILCADQERTLLEYDIKKAVANGDAISTKKLLFTNELVVGMHCEGSNVVLVGSQNGFRIIITVNGKRTLSYQSESVAPSSEERTLRLFGMRPSGNGRDRCMNAAWFSMERTRRPRRHLLLTIPASCSQTSQPAFRLKRFGRN